MKKSATTGKMSKIIYVPVNVPSIDSNWAFESVTSKDVFTKSAKSGMIYNIIINLAILITMNILLVKAMTSQITKPLSVIQSALIKISNYDLNFTEERKITDSYIDRNDEIGSMVRSLRLTTNNLISIISKITSNAQNTAATAEQLTATAQSTATSAEEVSASVNNIASSASSQAQDTQSAAESVENTNNYLKNMMSIIQDLYQSTNIIDERKNEGDESLLELVNISE